MKKLVEKVNIHLIDQCFKKEKINNILTADLENKKVLRAISTKTGKR